MNDGISSVKSVSDKGDHDLLATMRQRFSMAVDAYSENREDQLDDLRFYAGSPTNQWQWPADVLQTRGAVKPLAWISDSICSSFIFHHP